jgi:nickel-dependent lactate racemase
VQTADIVITTSAGYPLDTTLYQSVKGMLGALPAIKQGGTMILASSMSQGMGGHEFAEMCRHIKSVDDFIERIYNSPVIIDQWQCKK